MSDNDKLRRALDRWDSGFRPDSQLLFKVRAEAERRREAELSWEDERSFLGWLRNALARPVFAGGFACLFALVGVGVSQLFLHGFNRASDELTLTYRLSIDPLYRLQAVAGVDEIKGQSGSAGTQAPVLLAGLGWLQGQLDLSRPQYERISALHGDYEGAFDDLFVRLLESHHAYQEFDRKRMSNDVIDYFKVYELLQTQKQLSEESTRLTEELLEKVGDVIEPGQRARYRKLLDNVYPGFGGEKDAGSRDV